VSLAPKVILVQANADVKALLQETRTIPIVFASAGDPLADGLVDSLTVSQSILLRSDEVIE
jgi:putative ABC transport system substrate-binding protein